MLTGRQIREARKLLKWGVHRLAREASVARDFVAAIESSDGPAWLTVDQELAIRRLFEENGVEIGPNGSVRLRKVGT